MRVWTEGGELAWAEQAWRHLANAGLARADTELDRHRALLRFLVLPNFYRDWTANADDHTEYDSFSEWAYPLNLSPFVLGELLGPNVDIEEYTDGDRSAALPHLVPNFRDEVVQALHQGFGGDDDLFLSLWRVRHPAPDPQASIRPASDTDNDWEDINRHRKDNYEVINRLTTDKLVGYESITNGCPSCKWSREHGKNKTPPIPLSDGQNLNLCFKYLPAPSENNFGSRTISNEASIQPSKITDVLV